MVIKVEIFEILEWNVHRIDSTSQCGTKEVQTYSLCYHMILVLQVMRIQIRENGCPQSASEWIQKDGITTLIA